MSEPKLEIDKRFDAAEKRRKARKTSQKNPLNQKLWAPKKAGVHQRWINDEGGRLEQKLDKGYSFVENGDKAIRSEEDKRMVQRVGTDDSGNPIRAYLMEMPQQWHDEDVKVKQQEIAENEEQLLRGKVNGGLSEDDNVYGDIKVS